MLPRFNIFIQFWRAWWNWIVKLWCHENVSYIEIMFDENGCMVEKKFENTKNHHKELLKMVTLQD
jgi:hypothetical protein